MLRSCAGYKQGRHGPEVVIGLGTVWILDGLEVTIIYAVGIGIGGVIGPTLFGKLVDTEKRSTSSTAT